MCECDEGGCYCIIGRWPESSRKCVHVYVQIQCVPTCTL